MADKKIFTIEIDGVKQAYDNIIKLKDAINILENIELNIKDGISESLENIKKNESELISKGKELEEQIKTLTEEYKNLDTQLKDGQAGQDKLNEIRELNLEYATTLQQLKEQNSILSEALELYQEEINSITQRKELLEELNTQNERFSNTTNNLSQRLAQVNRQLSNTSYQRLNETLPQITQNTEELANQMSQESENAETLRNTYEELIPVLEEVNRNTENSIETINNEQSAINSLTEAVDNSSSSTSERIEMDRSQASSINGLSDQLKKLEQEYNSLSQADRKSTIGKNLQAQIKKVTKEIKDASNNNYGYVKSLKDMNDSSQAVGAGMKELSTLFNEANSILNTFGIESDTITRGLNSLKTATETLSSIQKIMNTVTSIATVVQQGFNLAIMSNPVMAMVSALILVVTALYGFVTATEEASEASEKNAKSNDKMNKSIEKTNELNKKAADEAISARKAYDELREGWMELKDEQQRNKFLEENRKKFEELGIEVHNVKDAENALIDNTEAFIEALNARALARASESIIMEKYREQVELEIQYQTKLKKFNEKGSSANLLADKFELDMIKKRIADKKEEIKVTRDLIKKQTEASNLLKDNLGQNTDNDQNNDNDNDNDKKENKKNKPCNDAKKTKENNKEEVEGLKELEQGLKELDSTRDKLSTKNRDRQEKEKKENAKSIEEIKEVQAKEVERLQEAQNKEIENTKNHYNNLLELAKDDEEKKKNITENKNTHIEELQKEHLSNLNSLTQAHHAEEEKFENKQFEEKLKSIKEQNAQIEELNKDKIKKKDNDIIDIDKTKENLQTISKLLNEYKGTLENNKTDIVQHYDTLAKTYENDSKKLEQINKQKEKALKENEKSIAETNKKIENNNKEQETIFEKYLKGIQEKLQTQFSRITDTMSQVGGMLTNILKQQVENTKEQLADITKQYDAVIAKRETSQEKLNSLEEEAKNATGGRAMVVQEQIARQMEANNELAKQEKDLAKQKEKLEKDKAKKEKQMKKIELGQQLISGIATTALAAIKALAAGPIWGPILAASISAAGAVQTGIIASQIAKLEDGGLLRGKRHSQGGMRIEGTNIEVEGDEYVVNRISTSKNKGLIEYINKNRRELNANDINSYFARSPRQANQQPELPTKRMFQEGGMLTNLEVVDNIKTPDNEKILNAISQINFQPVVSVVDIASAQDNLSQVKDIAGA